MNTDLFAQLAKEIATKLNTMLNIPLISEEDEQKFFELMISVVLDVVFSKLKGAMPKEK